MWNKALKSVKYLHKSVFQILGSELSTCQKGKGLTQSKEPSASL